MMCLAKAKLIVFEPFEIMGARLGNDLNIFGLLSDNSKPISTEKLAAITGADEHVLGSCQPLLLAFACSIL